MAFVERVIDSEETLIGIASLHWIYAAQGFAWLLGFTFAGFFLDHFITDFIHSFIDRGGFLAFNFFTIVGFITGVFVSLFYFIKWIATEIALTSKRLIYKSGLIFVDVKEADLEEIKGADVDNGMLGIFLNYGYLFFDARFIANVDIPAVSHPYEFVKAMNKARAALKSDSMKSVLENREGQNSDASSDKAEQDQDAQGVSKMESQPAPTQPNYPDLDSDEQDANGDQGPTVFETKETRRKRLKDRVLKSFKRKTEKA